MLDSKLSLVTVWGATLLEGGGAIPAAMHLWPLGNTGDVHKAPLVYCAMA